MKRTPCKRKDWNGNKGERNATEGWIERFRSWSIQTGNGECGFSLKKSHAESVSTGSSVSEDAQAKTESWVPCPTVALKCLDFKKKVSVAGAIECAGHGEAGTCGGGNRAKAAEKLLRALDNP
jgi:hypothetical protein